MHKGCERRSLCKSLIKDLGKYFVFFALLLLPFVFVCFSVLYGTLLYFFTVSLISLVSLVFLFKSTAFVRLLASSI